MVGVVLTTNKLDFVWTCKTIAQEENESLTLKRSQTKFFQINVNFSLKNE
jgi:hypothetical protein